MAPKRKRNASVPLATRVELSAKRTLKRLAHSDGRTLSRYCRELLETHAKTVAAS